MRIEETDIRVAEVQRAFAAAVARAPNVSDRTAREPTIRLDHASGRAPGLPGLEAT